MSLYKSCQELVVQLGYSATILESFQLHALISLAALLLPGLLVLAADALSRLLCNVFQSERKPPNEFLQLGYSYLPLTWLASLAHYLQLGLVEAGQVLPTAARTASFFASQLGAEDFAAYLVNNSKDLPSLSFAPPVVAFLQGTTLILAGAFSLQLLNKLGASAAESVA